MERIHVAVRARPLSTEDSGSSPWRISGNAISLSTLPSPKFEFDRIFGEDCRTADVYEARTKHIVDSAVRGFNGTVFAYGQTNSGKTYTMRGSASEPGIIPLAVHDLFQSIQEHIDREFLVRMSYMEIYNEEINDLLVPEHRKLQIHESLERGIYVAGLREEIVTCPEQVLDFMAFGESHRHIGETNMNLYSSRSHTIFRMIIESREKVDDSDMGDSCNAIRVSILNLVDLAGSERAAKTGAEGMRLKEGSHINKSLMTLGTVIKKLSEGTESQGGHVPYRDSKLTRILQPALGGNANTAIICNITLAQVHADETKSSLQFASRALRVTNCVCVNEILTDAALLKRQRKEIEELRAKLMNSQSEHWEEEILNLRNTLLQSELEKERIALELEEEKKAKEHRERRLIEQAKKIQNLSSLVLHSERDDKTTISSKNKRRVTWCPGSYWSQSDVEVLGPIQEGTMSNSCRHERNMGMPLPFEELMKEGKTSNVELCTDAFSPDDIDKEDIEDVSLPDAHALLRVTSRRKPNVTATNSSLKPEQEHTESERLTSKLIVQEDTHERNDPLQSQKSATEFCGISGLSAQQSEAILVIKQLQDQIKLLELEKSSIQNNLDNVLELATQQKNSFSEKYEELHENTLVAHEQARIANEQLSVVTSIGEFKQDLESDSLTSTLKETQALAVQVDQSRCSVDNVLSFVEELFQGLTTMSESLLEVKSSAFRNMSQFSSIIRDYEKISNYLMEKISKLDTEKNLLHDQYLDQKNELQELKSNLESCEKAMADRTLQHELEKDSILAELLNLQKEVLALSSSSLMKEKESIRKELDRTKTKLRETESKLKNSIQDKIRLESEKAQAEREIKKLQSQRALLERDLRKRDSLIVDKRRESKLSDYGKPKELAGMVDQALQMQDYQKLEVRAFEMEAEIASLQEALITSIGEKEEVFSKVEFLTLELEDFENKLNSAELEIQSLREEVAIMTQKLDAYESTAKSMESSLDSISREKEDMGMQLTDALLEMEAEKSMWIAKEKAFIEGNERFDISKNEICKLSEDLIKVRQELACCREQYRILEGKKVLSEENDRSEKKCCTEACEDSELICMDKGKHVDDAEYGNDLQKQLLMITEERDSLLSEKEHMSLLINEAKILKENYNNKLTQAKANMDELGSRISSMEVKMHGDALTYNKEKTKLRMQVRWMQAKLDAHCGRLEEAGNEMKLMNEKYQEASAKLKKELSNSCLEVMNLRKQLKKHTANQLEAV